MHIMSWALATPVTDHSGRTLDHFPGLALLINLAETSPLSKLHVGVDLDQWDAVLLTESGDKLLYMGSSQLSASMQSRACLLSRAFAASLRPLAKPSPISACFNTSWMAVLMSMGPEATGAADGTSSPSTSDMMSSLMRDFSCRSESSNKSLVHFYKRSLASRNSSCLMLRVCAWVCGR